MNCACCDGRKIYSMLPKELRQMIMDYIGYKLFNSLRCFSCYTYYDKILTNFISKDTRYNFHEEFDDPINCVKMMENSNVIKIYDYNEWNTLKGSFAILNIKPTKFKNKLLIEFTNINWMDCLKIGLVYDNKKVLFEINYENDMYKQIIIFLEHYKLINYVSIEDHVDNNFDQPQQDDFVIYSGSSEDDDCNDDCYYNLHYDDDCYF